MRAVNGTVGSSHTVGSIITEDTRRFSINSGFKTTFNFKRNKEVYFEPVESVGLGTVPLLELDQYCSLVLSDLILLV